MSASAAAGFCNSTEREYPQDEWRISGELIRQIAKATTWQRVIEAGDALMTVSRIAQSMRDERDHHARAEATYQQRTEAQEWLCLGGHTWVGLPESCCPTCGRRASAHALQPVT